MTGYTLIQSYAVDDATVSVANRTLPVPALVEDEHGIRMLLLAWPGVVSMRIYTEAHRDGVAAVVCVADDHEDAYSSMTVERFMQERSEDKSVMTTEVLDPLAWHHFTEPPTYSEVARLDKAPMVPVADQPTGTFVHVHAHSEYSALDGLSKVSEMVGAAVADGQPALVFTDHGNCAVHPEAQKVCDEAGIKACFGMEAYFVPDRHRRGKSWEETDDNGNVVKKSDSQEALAEYNHLILVAMNDQGLTNLWSASTEAYLTGFYGTPRLDWDTLERLNEGLIASTGCLRGPVCRPYLNGDEDRARMNLGRLYDIFGDRLYVEIHANHLDEQIKVNQFLVRVAREMGIPIVAAVDSHYPTCEDKQTHQYWLTMTTNKDIDEDTSLFAGGQDYHLMAGAEVRKALDYLPDDVVEEAIVNTVRLADRCSARVQGETHTPIYSKGVENPRQVDIERLVDLCASNWARKVKGKDRPEPEYLARFEREMALIILGEFPGYFLIVADYVRHAKKSMLVGPSRGSGGGSLVAYLSDITEIDPVENGLLFERFLNEGRLDSLPDFDIDFAASMRSDQKGFLIDRWGADYVATIGTITRMAAKLAINQAARIFVQLNPESHGVHWPDIEKVKADITQVEKGLAGKHVDWEKYWAEQPDDSDVAEIRRKYPQVFDLADRVVGRIKTYGKHAAGVVISTGEALTRLPLRVKDGEVITQFDMGSLELLGYVKFDILTLRTLDTLQVCLDLVKEKFGVDINVYDWREEYKDLQVWEALSDGDTLGVFQVETSSGTQLTKRFRPQSLHDLAAVMTIVRPGPKKSGLQETYLRRREGLEPVAYPHPDLEPVLRDTYGCMIYQEQIMEICQILAGYSLVEADEVRSILGKKKVEKVTVAGEKFISRCIAHGTDEALAVSLWAQMAEFAKYSFNKAHAFGYAVLGYWTAWFKFHFPAQFLTAALTTIDDDRIPEFVSGAQRLGYVIRPPDINLSKVGFSCTDTEILYGFQGVHGVGPTAAPAIVAGQPYDSVEDFLVKRPVDLGVCKVLAQVGAFDSMLPNRRTVEARVEMVVDKTDQRCKWWDDRIIKDHGLPCGFDWDSEPRPVGKGGKLLKGKPPPKKCTKACRNYEKGEPVLLDLAPYTPGQVREREQQLLGIHLSSTPFDDISAEDRALCRKASELTQASPGEEHLVAAIVKRVKEHVPPSGNKMAFLTLLAQDGDMEVVAFNKAWSRYRGVLNKDALVIAVVYQGDRGWVLSHAVAAAQPVKV